MKLRLTTAAWADLLQHLPYGTPVAALPMEIEWMAKMMGFPPGYRPPKLVIMGHPVVETVEHLS